MPNVHYRWSAVVRVSDISLMLYSTSRSRCITCRAAEPIDSRGFRLLCHGFDRSTEVSAALPSCFSVSTAALGLADHMPDLDQRSGERWTKLAS
jgi:hypothetical protein